MKLQELRQAIADLKNQVNALNREASELFGKAVHAEGEEADQLEKDGDAKLEEAKSIAEKITRKENLLRKQEALKAPVFPTTLPAGNGTRSTLGTGANPHTLATQEEPDEDEDSPAKAAIMLRYDTPDKAASAILHDLYGSDYNQLRYDQWRAFTNYLRDYQSEPSGEDQRLLKTIVLTPVHAKAAARAGLELKNVRATMLEAVGNLGGYVVPVDFQEEVIRRIRGYTTMRGRARTMQTSRDRVEIPKLTGGDDQYTTAVRVTWVSEVPTAGTADTNLTWGSEEISLNNVMAETFLSRNAVDDSAIDIIAELMIAFGEAQAIDEDNRFLTGSGVGVPQGIVIGGITPVTGVTTVNSGAAAALTADGIIDLQYTVPSQYRARCLFTANRTTWGAIRKLKDGDGRYLFERGNGGITEGQSDMLLGSPIAEQEVMPDIAAGTYPLWYGDPEGYRIVDRIGMSIERYLDSGTARTNRVLYIMNRRLGGQLVNPERWAVQLVSA